MRSEITITSLAGASAFAQRAPIQTVIRRLGFRLILRRNQIVFGEGQVSLIYLWHLRYSR